MLRDYRVEIPSALLQKDVASQLGVTTRTLRRWRRDGFGPVATRAGTSLLYDRAAVEAFARGVR